MNHHYTPKSTSKLSEKILKLHYCGNVTKINGKKIEIYQVSFTLDGKFTIVSPTKTFYIILLLNKMRIVNCEL